MASATPYILIIPGVPPSATLLGALKSCLFADGYTVGILPVLSWFGAVNRTNYTNFTLFILI